MESGGAAARPRTTSRGSSDPSAPSGRRRIPVRRLLIGALVLVVIGAAATLFGWNIESWFRHIWDTITTIPIANLIGALLLVTLQTTMVGYSWFSIRR